MNAPTNDAIRIAVAECLHYTEPSPNYTESLDACREVFQYFYEHDTVVQLTFDHLLWRVELFYGDNEYIVVVDNQTLPLGITEAFLRLKGKWPVTSV